MAPVPCSRRRRPPFLCNAVRLPDRYGLRLLLCQPRRTLSCTLATTTAPIHDQRIGIVIVKRAYVLVGAAPVARTARQDAAADGVVRHFRGAIAFRVICLPTFCAGVRLRATVRRLRSLAFERRIRSVTKPDHVLVAFLAAISIAATEHFFAVRLAAPGACSDFAFGLHLTCLHCSSSASSPGAPPWALCSTAPPCPTLKVGGAGGAVEQTLMPQALRHLSI
jgi:hypothetical protein